MCRITEVSGSLAPGITEALVLVNSFINDLNDEEKKSILMNVTEETGKMLWIPVSTEGSAKGK